MQLSARATSISRCPYCHDMLEDGGALVSCDACRTPHHQACAAELGRCSVLGCASLVTVDRTPGEAPERLEIRRRVRARLQRFVTAHSRRDPIATPTLRHRAEIVRAKEAWDRRDWPEARAARFEIEALERALEPAEVQAVWSALGFEPAELLREDPEQERARLAEEVLRVFLLRLGAATLVVVALLFLYAFAVLI